MVASAVTSVFRVGLFLARSVCAPLWSLVSLVSSMALSWLVAAELRFYRTKAYVHNQLWNLADWVFENQKLRAKTDMAFRELVGEYQRQCLRIDAINREVANRVNQSLATWAKVKGFPEFCGGRRAGRQEPVPHRNLSPIAWTTCRAPPTMTLWQRVSSCADWEVMSVQARIHAIEDAIVKNKDLIDRLQRELDTRSQEHLDMELDLLTCKQNAADRLHERLRDAERAHRVREADLAERLREAELVLRALDREHALENHVAPRLKSIATQTTETLADAALVDQLIGKTEAEALAGPSTPGDQVTKHFHAAPPTSPYGKKAFDEAALFKRLLKRQSHQHRRLRLKFSDVPVQSGSQEDCGSPAPQGIHENTGSAIELAGPSVVPTTPVGQQMDEDESKKLDSLTPPFFPPSLTPQTAPKETSKDSETQPGDHEGHAILPVQSGTHAGTGIPVESGSQEEAAIIPGPSPQPPYQSDADSLSALEETTSQSPDDNTAAEEAVPSGGADGDDIISELAQELEGLSLFGGQGTSETVAVAVPVVVGPPTDEPNLSQPCGAVEGAVTADGLVKVGSGLEEKWLAYRSLPEDCADQEGEGSDAGSEPVPYFDSEDEMDTGSGLDDSDGDDDDDNYPHPDGQGLLATFAGMSLEEAPEHIVVDQEDSPQWAFSLPPPPPQELTEDTQMESAPPIPSLPVFSGTHPLPLSAAPAVDDDEEMASNLGEEAPAPDVRMDDEVMSAPAGPAVVTGTVGTTPFSFTQSVAPPPPAPTPAPAPGPVQTPATPQPPIFQFAFGASVPAPQAPMFPTAQPRAEEARQEAAATPAQLGGSSGQPTPGGQAEGGLSGSSFVFGLPAAGASGQNAFVFGGGGGVGGVQMGTESHVQGSVQAPTTPISTATEGAYQVATPEDEVDFGESSQMTENPFAAVDGIVLSPGPDPFQGNDDDDDGLEAAFDEEFAKFMQEQAEGDAEAIAQAAQAHAEGLARHARAEEEHRANPNAVAEFAPNVAEMIRRNQEEAARLQAEFAAAQAAATEANSDQAEAESEYEYEEVEVVVGGPVPADAVLEFAPNVQEMIRRNQEEAARVQAEFAAAEAAAEAEANDQQAEAEGSESEYDEDELVEVAIGAPVPADAVAEFAPNLQDILRRNREEAARIQAEFEAAGAEGQANDDGGAPGPSSSAPAREQPSTPSPPPPPQSPPTAPWRPLRQTHPDLFSQGPTTCPDGPVVLRQQYRQSSPTPQQRPSSVAGSPSPAGPSLAEQIALRQQSRGRPQPAPREARSGLSASQEAERLRFRLAMETGPSGPAPAGPRPSSVFSGVTPPAGPGPAGPTSTGPPSSTAPPVEDTREISFAFESWSPEDDEEISEEE
ncbi:hypothetical protein QBC47DRAFT_442320 [Echria macrotheca]|uniref:Uncharacterized protein n=1 Tax=Echria macrotheca TaxID=438768 RepID=A0AAJ0FBK4_9PEZI|nr:hypothetical protein QBC47DRAFT_442320 [Echria macrotheca]